MVAGFCAHCLQANWIIVAGFVGFLGCKLELVSSFDCFVGCVGIFFVSGYLFSHIIGFSWILAVVLLDFSDASLKFGAPLTVLWVCCWNFFVSGHPFSHIIGFSFKRGWRF